MRKKILLCCSLMSSLFSADYKYDCKVPDKLMQAIRLTENESAYPYIIRTNDTDTLKKFHTIASKHSAKKTKDEKLVDCNDVDTCSSLTKDLVLNGITNIDLGLYQINFNSYPRRLDSYFIEQHAYRNACGAVLDKVRNAKKWNWEVLASYNSATPYYNKIYKDKLIRNYMKLSQN